MGEYKKPTVTDKQRRKINEAIAKILGFKRKVVGQYYKNKNHKKAGLVTTSTDGKGEPVYYTWHYPKKFQFLKKVVSMQTGCPDFWNAIEKFMKISAEIDVCGTCAIYEDRDTTILED